ncbi:MULTISPECIES: helix-turn-helix transcriptional regulator [Yersinia]|jgi:AraC-like DNA-binding protein|uniref:AraC family transcriptional regulator n=1 Tax=Yersinia intermedia TaxID=631 RepID=A0A0T9LSX2_YERIN|nr:MULTISPECIES: helix-turn-helix transcriptional regulator [Yersinia]AJJ19913.1 helix-turn-helix domain protein [Yersinia intermedia]ARB85450.1 AraC family transcriptional regulator [Yersinia sp. FDAARGOS_228]AVL35270.1 AraC family transcriptional regulator [Yersinia intermedia]EEQ18187.1 Transcriptional regulator, AraC family [Yersinia intermedia ATCC 29909]MCB5297305.1 helix-turn-helix transcriptional regulator [Yersinia intermedia]
MERTINFCPGVGSSAHVIQHTELLLTSVYIEHPLLIMVNRGHKIIRWDNQECIIQAGEIVAVSSGQTVDVINGLSDDGLFFSHQLRCDPRLIATFASHPASAGLGYVTGVMPVRNLAPEFINTFSNTFKAISDTGDIPPTIVRHRMLELLLWLAQRGVKFILNESDSLSERVRRCLAVDPHKIWSASEVADHMAMSEVVLRRKLAAEKILLRDLMIDVRMTSALRLLQGTDWPISLIASQVGYESASRFAERFRKRFGFAPTAIRGHHRLHAADIDPPPESYHRYLGLHTPDLGSI